MSQPHVIRLRHPWELEAADVDAGAGASVGIGYRRNFHCPTGLSEGDRVKLVFQTVGRRLRVELNEAPLGELLPGDEATSFEIRSHLQPKNALRLILSEPEDEAEATEPPPSPPDAARPNRTPLPADWVEEVRLEIFDART